MSYLQEKNSKRTVLRDGVLLASMAIVVALDQISKALVSANLSINESIPREGIFRITYTLNTGSAFGLFPDQTLFLIIASFIAIFVLLFAYRSHSLEGTLLKLSLGLQLGGAVGNLADRIRLGYVVDFIDVGWWPVFNLADSSIVIGLVGLIFLFLFPPRAKGRVKAQTSQEEGPKEPVPAPPSEGDGPQ